tara:strand:- start:1353 stop:1508 length:156 start_codon:yes stop_codon:yes gene_type:complete
MLHNVSRTKLLLGGVVSVLLLGVSYFAYKNPQYFEKNNQEDNSEDESEYGE